MVEVTQHFSACPQTKKSYNFRYYLYLLILSLVLYTSGILNTNIEQEAQNVSRIRTPQESEFIVATMDILYEHKKTGK